MGAFRAILPPWVAVVEEHGEPRWAPLYAEEAPAIRAACQSRALEFRATRTCARRALADLGALGSAIPMGPSRQPLWPDGFVGSITHTQGFRAAAVAAASSVGSLGIDAEVNRSLPIGVGKSVLSLSESEMASRLRARHTSISWDTIVFSAKESVFKLWYPLTLRWLDFTDVGVLVEPSGRLHATFCDAIGGHHLDGAWRLLKRGVVGTAFVLPYAEVGKWTQC